MLRLLGDLLYKYISLGFRSLVRFFSRSPKSSKADPTSKSTTVEKLSFFILPNLISHCTFPLSYHVDGDEVAAQSVTWLDANCPDLNAKQRRALRGLQAGELTAYCYPTTSKERLRVVSDFMNYLFHLYVHCLHVPDASHRSNFGQRQHQ